MISRNSYNLIKISSRLSQIRCYRQLLDIHPDVKFALANRKPVVALESTIISHGMPYPQNIETALQVEDVVKSVGAIPATIACVGGRLKVGLDKDDLHTLASSDSVFKCSRRDLPYIVGNKKTGGTTVAGTMIIANMAGIRIFATGGVGGVHRNGHISMDISADLVEMGRTNLTVVSSGIKSILDIGRTLEYLETQGVCVASYMGENGRFPDFYTRDSGYTAPYDLRGPEEAANLIRALHDLELKSGILIAVPIPKEYAAGKALVSAAIDQANKEAEAKGVTGKDVTPFLLAAIAKITAGNSLKSNIALIKNNARVAAEIACQLHKETESNFLERNCTNASKPLIIGASMIDLCLTMINKKDMLKLDGATYHTNAKQSAGGVGRNLAEGIFKLNNSSAQFLTAVGKDHLGESLLRLIPKSLRNDVHLDSEKSTAICSILFDTSGECKICLANMDVHKSISPELIRQHESTICQSPLVIMDGNLTVETMQTILELAEKYKKPVFYEPTDMLIAGKPFNLDLKQQIRFISPNIYELKTIVETLTCDKISWEPTTDIPTMQLLDECKKLLKKIEDKFDCIIVTLGAHGIVANANIDFNSHFFDENSKYQQPNSTQYQSRFYAAPKVENIVNVSGAGDSWTSGFITGLLRGYSLNDSIAFGFIAARGSLQSESAVPEKYFASKDEETDILQSEIKSLQFQQVK